MSDILADLEQAIRQNTVGRPCLLCTALAEMDSGVADAVHSAIRMQAVGEAKMASLLARHGHEVGRRAIIRHRDEGHSWNG